jgi:hypothetical protein
MGAAVREVAARAAGVCAVAVAMLLCLIAPARAQDKPVTFADVASVPALADADARLLAQYVGERLHEAKTMAALPAALKNDAAPRIVFVSVSDGEQSAHVAMSTDRGAVRAAEGAIAKAMKLLPDSSTRQWIKVDVVTRVAALANGAGNLALGINPSLDGLELAGGMAFLPEELLGWHLVEGDRFIESSLYDYLDARPARATARGDQDLRAIRRFGCASFFIGDDGAPIPLFRGHRAFETFTPADLHAAADAAGSYLIRSIRPTGQFDYSYRLDLDEVPRDYDIVRHAGTIWAMLELYRDTNDAELLAATERAMRYLLAQVRPMKIGGANVVGVVENDEVSLGGNALTALALATYIDVTGKKEELSILISLGQALRAAQNASGRFVNQRQVVSSGAVLGSESPYYPGEATLAMLKINDVAPDEALVDAAARGAKYLITVRDADVMPADLPHDHWLLYTLPRIYAKRPDKMFVAHAVKMCGAIVEAQHSKGSTTVAPDAVGSWMDARSTPAATRAEGLLATVGLMRRVGRKAEAEEYLAAAKASIAFQLRTQVWPEGAMHCRNPRRALGAFRDGPGGVYVRIDFVQHSTSSLLDLLRITGSPGK